MLMLTGTNVRKHSVLWQFFKYMLKIKKTNRPYIHLIIHVESPD